VGKIEIYRLEKTLNLLATVSQRAGLHDWFPKVLVDRMIRHSLHGAKEGMVSPKLASTGMY